jgi:hypothetical protein
MATKGSKGSKSSSSKGSSSGTAANTSSAATQTDSNSAATQTDSKKETMFVCIQQAFAAQGLAPITSPLNQIVWSSIPQDVIIKIASATQKCFKTKFGKDPGDLTGPIIVLSTHSPVMTVAKLIDDLDPLVKS